MRRVARVTVLVALAGALGLLPACARQMAIVETGEIVLCTEGHTVSDTVEQREVPASEVAEHGVTTSVITCDLHTKLAALYGEAERALAAGDTEAAERALAEITAQDASYRDAGARLSRLRGEAGGERGGAGDAGGTPSGTPGAGGGGATAPPGTGGSGAGGAVVGPIANLIHYAPDRIPGFVGQSLVSDPFALFRDYLPEKSGSIVQLSVEVEQFKDAAQAQRMLGERVRERFATNGQDVRIGALDGFVGTRPNYVRLGMTDRGILIMLEFYTTSDTPAEHKDAIIEAARSIVGR